MNEQTVMGKPFDRDGTVVRYLDSRGVKGVAVHLGDGTHVVIPMTADEMIDLATDLMIEARKVAPR